MELSWKLTPVHKKGFTHLEDDDILFEPSNLIYKVYIDNIL